MLVELTAMLLFSRAFERGNCVMQTENRKIADRFIDFLIDEFETILTVITAPSLKRNGTHLYTLTVDNPQDLDRIKEHFSSERLAENGNAGAVRRMRMPWLLLCGGHMFPVVA